MTHCKGWHWLKFHGENENEISFHKSYCIAGLLLVDSASEKICYWLNRWIPKIPKVLISQELCHDRKPKDQNNNTTLLRLKCCNFAQLIVFIFLFDNRKSISLVQYKPNAIYLNECKRASIKTVNVSHLWKVCTKA